jgi:hypothetical protein
MSLERESAAWVIKSIEVRASIVAAWPVSRFEKRSTSLSNHYGCLLKLIFFEKSTNTSLQLTGMALNRRFLWRVVSLVSHSLSRSCVTGQALFPPVQWHGPADLICSHPIVTHIYGNVPNSLPRCWPSVAQHFSITKQVRRENSRAISVWFAVVISCWRSAREPRQTRGPWEGEAVSCHHQG